MPLMRLSKKGKAERGKDESLFSPLAFSLLPTVIALVQQNQLGIKRIRPILYRRKQDDHRHKQY
jgi:hypothetical protein